MQPGTHNLWDEMKEMRRDVAVLGAFLGPDTAPTLVNLLQTLKEGQVGSVRVPGTPALSRVTGTTLCFSSLHSQRSQCREASLADPSTEASH